MSTSTTTTMTAAYLHVQGMQTRWSWWLAMRAVADEQLAAVAAAVCGFRCIDYICAAAAAAATLTHMIKSHSK